VSAIDPTMMGNMLAEGQWDLQQYAFDVDQAQVLQLADDVAVVAYPVRERLTVEGQPMSLAAYDASVWVRRDGAWRCALHTESIEGDPFGRDRTGA
jgi:hypothetical protein